MCQVQKQKQTKNRIPSLWIYVFGGGEWNRTLA
jgi:hypothetical protein